MAHIKIKKKFKVYHPRDIRHKAPTDRTVFGEGLERKNRGGFAKQEFKGILLKSIWHDDVFTGRGRGLMRDWIRNLNISRNRRGSSTKVKNRCLFVGHSRAIQSKLYMTRHTLRKFVRFGHLPGFVNLSK